MVTHKTPKDYYKNYLKSQYVSEILDDSEVKDTWGEVHGDFPEFVKGEVAKELADVEKRNPSVFCNPNNQMMMFLAVLVVIVVIFCILIYVLQKENTRRRR